MREIQFLVDALFSLVVAAFMLRLILQLVRVGADSRNPFLQAIVRFTNPLVMPLRKVLPPIGRLDTASVVAVILVQALRTVVNSLLLQGTVPGIGFLLASSIVSLLDTVLLLYFVAILIYVVLSWVSPDGYSPASRLLGLLVEPVLAPLRRALPTFGGLDLSPLIAGLLIVVLRMVLNDRIAPLLYALG